MKHKFSKWIKWDDRNELDGVDCPGIYAIAKTSKSLSGKSLSWKHPIIYIGMTNSLGGLKSRLQQFENTIAGKSGHGGAQRVIVKYGTKPKASYLDLYVAVLPVKCDVKKKDPVNLMKMGEVARLEYLAWAEFVKINKKLPRFNDFKRSKKA